ncbi:MAG: protein kinase [Rhodospirillales bacterium]|nr:protein kinase [Rhodospirillales bacterium]
MLYRPNDVVCGRYEIESFIGEGGMQEVYRANDRILSRQVALKTPKNRSAEKRFHRSAVVSAKVNHANVAKTLDYLEDGSRQFLVEELILGQDLGVILKESIVALDPLMAARVFHRLARGVAASHHAEVVHRDLKPSNIMGVNGIKLDDVKITDFGIAKMAEEELEEAVLGGQSTLTASQTAIGALPYMAPEMITSVKDADKPVDIWSLGALMFELATGKRPFGVGYAAVPAILEGTLPPLPSLVTRNNQFKQTATEIYEIIKGCIRIDPGDRPTADQLVKQCETLCYPNTAREIGMISRFDNGRWGFVSPENGNTVFFHINSIFGNRRVSVGDRVTFARHLGGGSDRAFPMVKIVPSSRR